MATLAKPEQRRNKILLALSRTKSKFKCGREVRKRKSLWALRIEEPPTVPHQINVIHPNDHMKFHVKGRVIQVIKTKKSFTSAKNNDAQQSQKIVPKLRNCVKNGKVSKCRSVSSRSENSSKKILASKIKKDSEILHDDDIAIYGLLESYIPYPENFKGYNHPFKNLKLTSSKSANAKPKRNRICDQLISETSSHKEKCQVFVPEPKRRKLPNVSVSCYSVLGTRNKTLNNNQTGSDENDIEKSSNNELAFVGAKAFLSQCLQTSEYLSHKQSLSVIGKRTTTSGKVQYLVEWDR